MNLDQIAEMIKRDEGYSAIVYKDTEGVLTVGYGHALHVGSTVPLTVINDLFRADFRRVMEDFDRLCDIHPGVKELFGGRKAVIFSMLFQLGYKGTLGFKNMLEAVDNKLYATAASEIRDSLMAKQTPHRADRYAQMMETGEEVV